MTSLSVHYIQRYSSQRSHEPTAAAFHDFSLVQMLLSLSVPVGVFSTLCSRLSICIFLLRIFRSVRAWRWGLYTIMAFATAVTISTAIILLAECRPIQKKWDPLLPGSCWPLVVELRTSYMYGGKYQCAFIPFTFESFAETLPAASVFCDWTLATLPIVFMWNVQMRVRVKVGICVLMGLGYLYDRLRGPGMLRC